MIEFLSAGLSPQAFAAALAVTFFAGAVKGAVGFAMPMILVSAFAVFLPKDLALAGLILPTLATNLSQAFRQGVPAARATAITYRRFLIGTVMDYEQKLMSAGFTFTNPNEKGRCGCGESFHV